jgi:hypothetical protein
MKAGFRCLMSLLAMVCASYSQANPSGMQPSKGAKIYFHGKGPDREVRRFQKFLDIALDDFDMVRTDSARDAAASIDMEITREEKTEHLYAPVLWITIASNDHQEYTLKSCNSVSDRNTIFNEPIESIEKPTLPVDWKKRGSHLAIYVKDPEIKGMPELVPSLIASFKEGGYEIAKERARADAELQSVKMQKLAIPMRSIVVSRSYEVSDRQSNRPLFTGKTSGDVTYMSVDPAVKLENLPCRMTVETFGQENDGAWQSARSIAKDIRKHLDKAAHSN